jgi:anti-sigma regulatory factor (Ser/Thr protein kinase)
VMESAPADLDAFVDHVLDMVAHEARSDDLAVLALRVIERPAYILQRRWESRISSLRGIRRELRAFLHSAGLREDDTDELIVAMCEAAANAIEHPLKTTQPSFEVKVEVRDDEVVACVRDFGQWDDTDPEPDRGHGLPLIRTLVNVEVHQHVDGTRVRMRRVLRDRS